MKNILRTGLFTLLTTLILAGCIKEDEYYYDYLYSYGNIIMHSENRSDGFSIELDNGNMLIIDTNRVPYVEVNDGQRIYAQYSIIGLMPTNIGIQSNQYSVDLYGLSTYVLEKEPVKQSEITVGGEITEESLGDDPIEVEQAWFGSRYLNVEFEVYSAQNSATVHFINLVWDDTRVAEPGDNTLYLRLRHNGYDDVPSVATAGRFTKKFGRASFDISEIIPDGADRVPVKLIWDEYGQTPDDRIEKSITGLFIYPANDNTFNRSADEEQTENSERRFYDTTLKVN